MHQLAPWMEQLRDATGEVMARFENGWVKFYRRAWEEDIGGNVYCLCLWVALLSMAHWKESKVVWEGRQRVLPPGSVIFGIKELSDKWGCSRSVIKKWLHYLNDTGRIVLETCPRGTIATICNWEIYQAYAEEESPQRVHNETSTRHQRDINEPLIEEDKKLRKKEYKIFDEKISECIESWGKTLQRFRVQKDPKLDAPAIGGLIQRHGLEKTKLALLGAGFEEKTPDYNPAKHVSIMRLLKPDLFEKFVNLGAQASATYSPEKTENVEDEWERLRKHSLNPGGA